MFFSACKRENVYKFSKDGKKIIISLVEIRKDFFDMRLQIQEDGQTYTDSRRLPYPVYRFLAADITGDGIPEIAVCIIKTTDFDKEERKRLFLFQIRDKYIQPLWLGSKMPLPLVDFKLVENSTGQFIITLEEKNGKFAMAKYKYDADKFGPQWLEYKAKGLN